MFVIMTSWDYERALHSIVLCCCPAGKVDYHEGPAGGYDDEWFHPHREPRRDYYPVGEGKVRASCALCS